MLLVIINIIKEFNFILIYLYINMMIEERYHAKLRKPKRDRGVWAWIKRWFFCGYREERRTMKIYMEICQMDELYENEI